MKGLILSIIGILIELIIMLGVIITIYKEYKNSNTITEKTLFWLMVLLFLYPIVIYTFDKTNLASRLGWVDRNNYERWFNYIATYGSALAGAIIGATALVMMTIFQLQRQDEKDKETTRINNMPLLSYKVSKEKSDVNSENHLITNYEDGYPIDFTLKIKNVGMNTVKKSFVVFSSKDLSSNSYSCLENNGCISKNEELSIERYLELPKGKYVINLTIFYCDLINNWYRQKIAIGFEITDCFDGNEIIYIPSIKVEGEELIKGAPSELIKHL